MRVRWPVLWPSSYCRISPNDSICNLRHLSVYFHQDLSRVPNASALERRARLHEGVIRHQERQRFKEERTRASGLTQSGHTQGGSSETETIVQFQKEIIRLLF